MASRRHRITAIANVPIRRGKGNDREKIGDVGSAKEQGNEIKVDTPDKPIVNLVPTVKCELKEELPNTEVASSLQSVPAGTANTDAGACIDNVITRTESVEKYSCLNSENTSSDSLREPSTVSESVTTPSTTLSTNPAVTEVSSVSSDSKVSTVLGRKRLKPSVNIARTAKKPKDDNNITGPKGDSEPEKQHNSETAQNSPAKQESSPCSDLKSVTGGVSSPEVVQTIPTGTAIRPQQVSVSSEEQAGESPQSLREADLPSEGAGGGGNAGSKVLHSTPHTLHRSRFAKPTPRIPDSTSRKAHRQVSESDEDSRGVQPTSERAVSPVKKSLPKNVQPSSAISVRPKENKASIVSQENLSKKTTSVAATDPEGGSKPAEDVATIKKELSARPAQQRSTGPSRLTPSTRRLVQAQKRFSTKFKDGKLDRSQLTMFDLIHYNPTSNPMKPADIPAVTPTSEPVSVVEPEVNEVQEQRLDEEAVDDDLTEPPEDDISAMPVPQVKVGPDGQIILDEQSLVIEVTDAKKNRENLANSAVVVDYGINSTNYGTFSKRNRKQTEWSERETVKFYRALHTVGTDFLLMQSIFPNRTRHELKMKFKREDRLNRSLVEKTLRSPLIFDLTEMQKELEKEKERETEEKEAKLKKQKKPRGQKRRRVGESLSLRCIVDEDTQDENKSERKKKVSQKKRQKVANKNAKTKSKKAEASTKKENKNKTIVEPLSEQEAEGSTSEAESDAERSVGSNTEKDSDSDGDELAFLKKDPKPTRSGRVPHLRKRTLEQVEEEQVQEQEEDGSVNISTHEVEHLPPMEPGSLVVLASESPDDPTQKIFKVFMVTPMPSQKGCSTSMNNIQVPSDVLQSVANTIAANDTSQAGAEAQVKEVVKDFSQF